MSNGRLQHLKLSQQRFRCWNVRDESGRSNKMSAASSEEIK